MRNGSSHHNELGVMTITSVLRRISISPLPVPGDWYALPLRLIVGFGFFEHGYAKLSRGPDAFIAILHAIGMPFADLLGWATIGEAHPELIFRRLGSPLRLEGKKSARGRDQRVKLLADFGFVKLSRWLTQRYGTGIGRDDLIDACACAIAARDSSSRLGGDEVDLRGLRMEINY